MVREIANLVALETPPPSNISIPAVRESQSGLHREAGARNDANSTYDAAEALSPTAELLLRVANEVSRDEPNSFGTDVAAAPLSEFVQVYRQWIVGNRGKLGTQEEQARQWQLILYAMITAPNVEEAIRLLIRFGQVVWGDRGPSELRREGECAAIVFSEPFRAGPEGLIAALWLLSLTLCELEFLAGAKFVGSKGQVMHDDCLPAGVPRLLFGSPIVFETNEVALLVPWHHLRRPVSARSADLPNFFSKLLPLTLGAKRETPALRTMIEGLIRDDKVGPVLAPSSLENVAPRLGMSVSTLRRRLKDEGSNYRQIKEAVCLGLAKDWLLQSEIAVGEIAERLDFSNAFAFRRFFRRVVGVSPTTFRDSAATRRISSG